MRISTPARAAIVVAALSVITACHDDAMTANPVAPSPPALAVDGDGTWMVNSLADPGDGVCTNSQCTLREAIGAAQNGEQITFKQNLTGTIALTAGELVIDEAVVIEGPGADRIAVNGQNASRVVRIGAGPGVTLSGLTIMRGNAPPGEIGGGLFVDLGGRLTLIGMVVTGNTADKGGGIASFGALALVGSTVVSNMATDVGGGVFVGSQLAGFAQLTVRRSTISSNSAMTGGGIYLTCLGGCPVTISSSTITANSATFGGGGLLSYSADVTMFNTIIAGNRAQGVTTGPESDCHDIGQFQSLGFNLTSAGTGCSIAGPTDVVVPALQVFTSVLESIPAANASPRPTHALIERGYAVDAGYCPGESADQRGFPRPYDDLRMPNALDGCDIGAFEWQPADTKIKGPKP